MNFSLAHWLDWAETVGVRLLVIIVLAAIVIRIWKIFTSRLIEISKGQTRVGHMREQQTRTVAGILSSAGVAIVVTLAILMALQEFGVGVHRAIGDSRRRGGRLPDPIGGNIPIAPPQVLEFFKSRFASERLPAT